MDAANTEQAPRWRGQGGFTLSELALVLVVVVGLLVVATVSVRNIRAETSTSNCQTDLRTLKLATEQYPLAYQQSYGMETLAFRFFNVFGPRQRAGHVYAAVIPTFVDALLRPAEAYVATGKLTKPAWLLILGLAVGAALVFPSVFGLLGILGIVAALVYVLDVRPALVSVTRR